MRLDEGAQQAAVGVVQRHIVADHDGPCERPRLQVRQHVVHDVLEERQRVHATVALGVSDMGKRSAKECCKELQERPFVNSYGPRF